MKCPVLLIAVFLADCCFQPVSGDSVASDEHGDIGHDEEVHPSVLTETNTDIFDMNVQTSRHVPDTNLETNWDVPDLNKDYEDADRHPPALLLETPADPLPGARQVPRGGDDDDGARQTLDQTGASARCGEHGSQLTADGLCRLVAALPPVGTSQKHCPDIFRCTDDVSYWVGENQDRKEQLEELRETMSELQEELRNHRHRVKGLETKGANSSLEQRLRFLELRHAEAGTLLHVHAALLHELQLQPRNLSAAARLLSRNMGCSLRGRAAALGMRSAGPAGAHAADAGTEHGASQGAHHLSFCPADCASLHRSGVRRSGVYTIALAAGASLPVYCDMETEGGGWTVFQRRRDGSVSFNRGWSEYRTGFGEPRGEHWLGNQHLHLLTTQGQCSLRIELQDWSRTHRHALYDSFRVESEENRYRLRVSGFSGTVEDSFGWYHDLLGFSTPDTGNICAEISHSGWWFHQCFQANLNGVYYKGGRYSLKAHSLLGPDGIVWFSWKNSDFYSLKAVTMMIRPRGFRPRASP